MKPTSQLILVVLLLTGSLANAAHPEAIAQPTKQQVGAMVRAKAFVKDQFKNHLVRTIMVLGGITAATIWIAKPEISWRLQRAFTKSIPAGTPMSVWHPTNMKDWDSAPWEWNYNCISTGQLRFHNQARKIFYEYTWSDGTKTLRGDGTKPYIRLGHHTHLDPLPIKS